MRFLKLLLLPLLIVVYPGLQGDQIPPRALAATEAVDIRLATEDWVCAVGSHRRQRNRRAARSRKSPTRCSAIGKS